MTSQSQTLPKVQLSVSMMCVPLKDLPKSLKAFEAGGIDYLHIDVMDGCFVPNYALGTDYIAELRKLSSLPLDLHLMITQPEYKLDRFDLQPTDLVAIHAESTVQIHRTLSRVKQYGCRALLALNPGTPFEAAENVLDELDGILIMTVDPGFAGQKMVESCMSKVGKLRSWLSRAGRPDLRIEVDGNINETNAKRLRKCGADLFVLGSSSIFGRGDLATASRGFRNRIG